MAIPAGDFVSGLELSERFFHEAVRPIVERHFSGITYSAALIGDGSEVLGFDTPMSTDHDWGPRLQLFLPPKLYWQSADKLAQLLANELPRAFRGYPTSFTAADEDDNGTQLLDHSCPDGPINHRVEILTRQAFFLDHLGFDIDAGGPESAADWLTFPEQKLATITGGRVFHDAVGLEEARGRFSYYPNGVWLYLLASGWHRIGQEDHLMGRAGHAGDETGSAIIAARLVRDLMRLCFLMARKYAPYPKWFGTAFSRLPAAERLTPIFSRALAASTWQEREQHLVEAYEYVAKLHNDLGLTPSVDAAARSFFNRPFQVVTLNGFADALLAEIKDPEVKAIASRGLIGSIDQISDNTDILSHPRWRAALRRLYE